ncbi:MAG TPA: HAD family phosphatase [Candidatus Polarisedimenticolia bacterium]|nr:HAD family phosphatase [Candidatus Polarisedimenticolia bacterium]
MAAYRAVVFDVDGTLTPVRSVWKHLHEALGLWDGAAMGHQRAFEAGEIGYREWCALDAAHWTGRRVSELKEIADMIPYRDGARESVAALRAGGTLVGIVTTGLNLLAERVRDDLRLDHAICNRLESRAGILTGQVEINVEHDRKNEALERFCRRFNLSPDQVVAIGDSEGDIPMFRMAGFSVAVCPSSRRTADAASVVLQDESLAGLLALLPAARPEGSRMPAGSR